MVSGMLIVTMAFHLVWNGPDNDIFREHVLTSLLSLFRLMAVVVITDFVICLDNIIVISQFSSNIILISLAIAITLTVVFSFIHLLAGWLNYFPWLQIVISGFMTQIAFLGMAKDPLLKDRLNLIRKSFHNMTSINLMDVISIDAAVFVIIIGLLRRNKKRYL